MAVAQPRLSSTGFGHRRPAAKLILARRSSSNAGYLGRRPRTDRNASDRGSPRIAPETEPETNRYATVHSQIDCRMDTVTTNLRCLPAQNLCPGCGVPCDQPGLITRWKTNTSDHVLGNSLHTHRSAPAARRRGAPESSRSAPATRWLGFERKEGADVPQPQATEQRLGSIAQRRCICRSARAITTSPASTTTAPTTSSSKPHWPSPTATVASEFSVRRAEPRRVRRHSRRVC